MPSTPLSAEARINAHATAPKSLPPSRCLVTGGSGFIGCHLVRLLLDRGCAVRVVDLVRSPFLDHRAEFVGGSVLDASLMCAAMADINHVYHLAADPNLWAPDKRSFMETNFHGTRVVLKAAARAGVRRIVHTSTESIVKGFRRGERASSVDESARRTLDDMPGPYCRSKYLAEQEALEAAGRGLPVVVVNPTLPVGPGDHRMTPPTRMILDFLNGKYPAYLDFEMNLIDVRDVALGHLLAAENGRIGERYILGGENLCTSRLLESLHELTGLPMPRIRVPYLLALSVAAVSEFVADYLTRRPPKAPLTGVRIAGASMVFDCSKAKRELGLETGPVYEALGAEIACLSERGLIRRPLPTPALHALSRRDPPTG